MQHEGIHIALIIINVLAAAISICGLCRSIRGIRAWVKLEKRLKEYEIEKAEDKLP